MNEALEDRPRAVLFREERPFSMWLQKPVSDETLHELYELLKWAPTSANATPARFAFIRSREAKERLRPALPPHKVKKTMATPVTVIVGYDVKFYEQLPKLFPHSPGMKKLFESNPEAALVT